MLHDILGRLQLCEGYTERQTCSTAAYRSGLLSLVPQLGRDSDASNRVFAPQSRAQAEAAAEGDEQLAELLMAWYNAGFEMGRRHKRRRTQPQRSIAAAAG